VASTLLRAAKAARGGPEKPPLSRSSIRAYALFWVLGGAFLWWPWVTARAILARRRGERPATSLLATAGLLAVSLAVAAIAGSDLLRVVGAGVNLAIWLALVLWSGRRWRSSEVNGVLQGIVDLAVVQAVLALVARLVYPAFSGFELPLARILPDAMKREPNIEALSTVRLAYPDFFGEPVIRTAGLFGNATWAGGLAGLGLVVLLLGSDRLTPALRRPAVRTALIAS
jgi:hypothetical protein